MIARRIVWLVVSMGSIAIAVVLTPLVSSYARPSLSLAAVVLGAASIAGLHYDARSRNR